MKTKSSKQHKKNWVRYIWLAVNVVLVLFAIVGVTSLVGYLTGNIGLVDKMVDMEELITVIDGNPVTPKNIKDYQCNYDEKLGTYASGDRDECYTFEAKRIRFTNVPEELKGEWCSTAVNDIPNTWRWNDIRDEEEWCMNIEKIFDENPKGSLSARYSVSGYAPREYMFCFTGGVDGCASANTLYIRYYAVDIQNDDCLAVGDMIHRGGNYCTVAYEHNASKPRIKRIPNHQQGKYLEELGVAEYAEYPPMYRK